MAEEMNNSEGDFEDEFDTEPLFDDNYDIAMNAMKADGIEFIE